MNSEERDLRQAINDYVQACGGNIILTTPRTEATWANVLTAIGRMKRAEFHRALSQNLDEEG